MLPADAIVVTYCICHSLNTFKNVVISFGVIPNFMYLCSMKSREGGLREGVSDLSLSVIIIQKMISARA